MSSHGALTLSLEVELGWGFHDIDTGSQYISDRRERETEMLQRLLTHCEKTEIPISFDIVGHLFLPECTRIHGQGYPNGWFEADPGTNVESDPLFYAPDLVEMIAGSELDHEICTHTFSHVLCDEISEEVLQSELNKVVDVHQKVGYEPPTSFVPPRHRPVPNKILAEQGIETVRMAASTETSPKNSVQQYISSFLPTAPIVPPQLRDGVIETYCSPSPSLTTPTLPTGQATPHPAYKIVPRRVRRRIHERNLLRSLEQVANEESYIHHWTHLYNMANEQQWEPIESFLTAASELRDSGALHICTMDQLQY